MKERKCKWCGAEVTGKKTKFCSSTHRIYDKQFNWLSRQKTKHRDKIEVKVS
jgi:hypothetical protein